jgi:hypothetical protein
VNLELKVGKCVAEFTFSGHGSGSGVLSNRKGFGKGERNAAV